MMGIFLFCQREPHGFADGPVPARVFGMDGDGGVAEHGFGAGGGDGHEFVCAVDGVADVPEAGLYRFMVNLVVGDRGLQDARPN